jgi:feruloyl esterase
LIADQFVVAGSNGGHRATQYPGVSFASDPTLVLGYAHTAMSQTDTVAYALMNAYYGHGPQYRYFDGCSNGGKNASIAASLLGNDYDGVIGGDGVYGHADDHTGGSDMPGLTAAWARATQVGTADLNPATLGPKLTRYTMLR